MLNMFSSVHAAAKVLSIRDVDYQLPVDDTFHPSCMKGAIKRLSAKYAVVKQILPIVMKHQAAQNVWGIVFEKEKNPCIVFSNLKYSNVRPQYRRILRVDLDAITESNQKYKSWEKEHKFTIDNDKYVPPSQQSATKQAEDSTQSEASDEESELNAIVHFDTIRRDIAMIAFLLVAIFVANAFTASNLQVLVSKYEAT